MNGLRCDVGYWKSRHADAVERNTKLQAELDEAKAKIRQLKAEHFGKKTEKQSASDRTNRLNDPTEQTAPKKKRGQQPGSPAVFRRDDSHLPARIQEVDVPNDAKVCACCGLPLEGLGQHEDSSLSSYRNLFRTELHAALFCPHLRRMFTNPTPVNRIPSGLTLFKLPCDSLWPDFSASEI